MKTIYFLLLFAFAQHATAQDFCKLVKKEVSADKVQFNYFSPFTEDNQPALRVTRSINIDPEMAYDNFFIVFRLSTGNVDFEKEGDTAAARKNKTLVVEFEDKSKIVDDTVDINHDVTEDKAEGIAFLFYPITEDNFKDFGSKKITKFSLGAFDRKIPVDSANAVVQYVKCMKTATAK